MFNRRDFGALALADPDIEVIPLIPVGGRHPYIGREGVRRWWENWLHIAPDFSAEVEEGRDLGDVTVRGPRSRTRHRERHEMEQTLGRSPMAEREDRSSSDYGSEAEALEAAGLSE